MTGRTNQRPFKRNKHDSTLTGAVEIKCAVVVVFLGGGEIVAGLTPDLFIGAQHDHHESILNILR